MQSMLWKIIIILALILIFPFCLFFFLLQLRNTLRRETEERGEEYKVTKMRRNIEMDEYDFLHWRRSLEEREALIRDISWYCKKF